MLGSLKGPKSGLAWRAEMTSWFGGTPLAKATILLSMPVARVASVSLILDKAASAFPVPLATPSCLMVAASHRPDAGCRVPECS